jgi:hypothetical protein
MHVPLERKTAPVFSFSVQATLAARGIGGYPAVIRGEGGF